MSERKSLIRAFFTSFFITLIITLFLLNLFWVDMRARENGFAGFEPPVRLEQQDELHYRMITARGERALDLTPLNEAAGFLQTAERWMLPEDWRLLSRLSCFIADSVKNSQREAREREFYKNAGLV